MMSFNEYFCPDWDNLTIQGNFYSPQFKWISMYYYTCDNKTSNSCASAAEMDSFYAKSPSLKIMYINSYFDSEIYTNSPISYFLDFLAISLVRGKGVFTKPYLKNNTYTLYDSLFGFIPNKYVSNFIELGAVESRLSEPGPTSGNIHEVASIGIWLDKNYDVYRRDVYSFNLVMRDVGGIYTAMFSMGLFFCWLFRDALYFTSLISLLYETEISPKK